MTTSRTVSTPTKTWDDFPVGEVVRTQGRTVTEADLTAWSGQTGDYYPIHVDREFAERSDFGVRIAHGPLVFGYAVGLVNLTNYFADSLVCWLGLEDLRMRKPVLIGDTIRVHVSVLDKRSTSRPERGVTRMTYSVRNQADSEVLSCVMVFMMHRRG